MPSPDPATFYIVYDDGSVDVQTVVGDPIFTKPGRLVDQAEYNQYKGQLDQLNLIYASELKAADDQVAKNDYDALIALGMPEATARRISGYTGP